MKTFNELSEKQQVKAVEYHLQQLLEQTYKGEVSFDREVNLALQRVWLRTGHLQKPSQIFEHIRNERLNEEFTAGDYLRTFARDFAASGLYPEPSEYVVHIPGLWKEKP